ncbi:hypothetical protein ACTXN4_19215 [Pseudomonas helleri]|uniref:Uncharacterized protein n=1 Tax=Pseudomonas helleri TaxID=1608996 RepID=A0A7X1Y9L1_9PSED|nr:hypothetical protein [Pseudomonas helleri]KMN22467.1 hypothetical protein TU85_14020 [Pseudomonas helleri]MQT76450.1 hypothetical protein [Pseudomonas helleri]MQT97435.1 hypothetical protein [Pseudomonas helleri]MQU33084.1 hypothetical protein [Pseudomonas helleri]
MPPLEAVPPSNRPDVWANNAAPCAVRFCIQAEAEADVLCRVLNLFALQQLVPRHVEVLRDDDSFSINIVSDEQSWHRAQVIGEKLRNLVSVFDMTLELDQPARSALTG